jgi:hypothetical protein
MAAPSALLQVIPGALRGLTAGAAMCDLCDELDFQIEQCKTMEQATSDELMREALATLIVSYEQDKTRLHVAATDEG